MHLRNCRNKQNAHKHTYTHARSHIHVHSDVHAPTRTHTNTQTNLTCTHEYIFCIALCHATCTVADPHINMAYTVTHRRIPQACLLDVHASFQPEIHNNSGVDLARNRRQESQQRLQELYAHEATIFQEIKQLRKYPSMKNEIKERCSLVSVRSVC